MSRRRFILLTAAGAFLAASLAAWSIFSPSLRSFVPPAETEALAQTEGYREDLIHLRRLPHVDGSFAPEEIEAFNRELDQIAQLAAELEPAMFEMMVSRAVALAGNGHTYVRGTHLGEKYARVPIELWFFEEGVHIMAAAPEFTELVGSRLVAIDGRSVEELVETLQPYVAGTSARRAYRMPNLLTSPALLHAVGLAASPHGLTIGVADGSEGRRNVRVEARPPQSQGIVGPIGNPAIALAPTAEEPAYWRRWLEAGVLYVRLRRVEDAIGAPQGIDAFLADTLADEERRGPRSIIVDLRASAGGNYTKALAFSRRLPAALPDDGRLFILVGRETFSAGLITAARLKHFAGDRAVLIGEPMGDDPEFWAEGGRATLPYTDVELRYSNALHDWRSGCGLKDVGRCFWMNFLHGVGAGDLSPHVSVPLRFADYRAGRDRTLEVALEMAGSAAR